MHCNFFDHKRPINESLDNNKKEINKRSKK